MPVMTSALIRLYPRAWRERYGEEMHALLDGQKPSLRTWTDLVAGAIDARVHPQRVMAASIPQEGATTMTMVKASWCAQAGVSTQDQRRSAAWMVGGTAGLMIFAIALQLKIGSNSLSESLIYAGFPASLMLSSECTYLRRYSQSARRVISIGGAIFVVLVVWAATVIGYRL
ncbi:MAG: hypothetical protein ABIP65_10915 [Vicinamibacterales bacterium]